MSKILKTGRTGLLLFAASFWILGGVMLIQKGFSYLPTGINYKTIKIIIAFVGGILFYFGMFTRISGKYIKHINEVSEKGKQILFKAFTPKAYIMLVIMISMGVTARKTGIFPIEYLALFYFTMGTPLLISAGRYLLHINRNFTK